MAFSNLFNRFLSQRKPSFKHVLALFSFIFVIWAVYRYFPGILPSWAEEIILKPVVWLLPTIWLVTSVEKEKLVSLGLTKKNLLHSIYWGIGLGFIFAFEGLLAHIIKHGGLKLVSLNYSNLEFLWVLVVSFISAFCEETVFRGYIFNRLRRIWKSELPANLISSLLFTIIYLPVVIFVLSYQPSAILAYLIFVFIFGMSSAFVFARTGNLVTSILLHVFWSWPIVLFR